MAFIRFPQKTPSAWVSLRIILFPLLVSRKCEVMFTISFFFFLPTVLSFGTGSTSGFGIHAESPLYLVIARGGGGAAENQTPEI